MRLNSVAANATRLSLVPIVDIFLFFDCYGVRSGRALIGMQFPYFMETCVVYAYLRVPGFAYSNFKYERDFRSAAACMNDTWEMFFYKSVDSLMNGVTSARVLWDDFPIFSFYEKSIPLFF